MKLDTATLAALFAAACIGAATPAIAASAASDADHRRCKSELERATLTLEQTFVRRDIDAFMAPFLDDALQVTGSGQVLDGKPAITAFYKAVMAHPFTFKRTLLSQKIDGCSSAIVADRIEFTTEAGATSSAIDVANWIHVKGEWRLITDTTTPSAKS